MVHIIMESEAVDVTEDVQVGVIASQLRLPSASIIPLSVGDAVIGWHTDLLPCIPYPSEEAMLWNLNLYILQGLELRQIALREFLDECDDRRLPVSDFLMLALFKTHLTLHLPRNSVDWEERPHNYLRQINYTEKSFQTMFNTLTRYTSLLKYNVQAKMNAMEPPQFLEMYAVVAVDTVFTETLSWRGTTLDDIVSATEMVKSQQSRLNQFSNSEVRDLAEFRLFVRDMKATYKFPILVKAENDEEVRLGRKLLDSSLSLDIFLSCNDFDCHTKVPCFYLYKSGDSLEDWLIGKARTTVSEIHSVALKYNTLNEL